MISLKFSRPKGTRRRAAFSLVLSLTVMAMLLLLCLSAAALLTVELRVSRATSSYARARLNAMAGARIALGEIQRTLGPDQRVSATADILGDPAQTDPRVAGYYLNDKYGKIAHPRWVGVWNSGRVVEREVPGAGAGESTKVVQRTSDGFLMDSRFAGGRDWAADRANSAPASTTKRFTGWLVSGNEALAGTDQATLTPFTSIDITKDAVMLGAGTLGSLFSSGGDSDQLAVRVRKVTFPEVGGGVAGNFAYWVADEGVKARINLTNKYAKKPPNAAALNDGGYYNLVIPQRGVFDKVQSPVTGDAGLFANYSDWDNAGLAAVTDFGSLALLSSGMDATKVRAEFFHDITFNSAGVLADVTEGGLRKDLTPYLAGGPIGDYSGVGGSGLADAAALLADARMAVIGPRLGLLRNWFNAAPANNSVTVTAAGIDTVVAKSGMGVPSLANPTNLAPVSPVLTGADFSYRFAAQQVGTAYEGCFMVYPHFRLWNPYGVKISIKGMKLVFAGASKPTSHTSSGSIMNYVQHGRVTYTVGDVELEPGQSKHFVVATPGQKIPANQADQTIEVAMTVGVPDVSRYYLDPTRQVSSTKSSFTPTDINKSISYYWLLSRKDVRSGAYDDTTPVDQYFITSNDKVLQQVNMDTYSLMKDDGYGEAAMADGFSNETLQDVTTLASSFPSARLHHGFRMAALDDELPTVTGTSRNTNQNPFVSFNFRSAVQSRSPFDMAVRSRQNYYTGTGIYTTDTNMNFNDIGLFSTSAADCRPFLLSEVSGGKARFAILDVPRRDLGLHSLGQLQHAPLALAGWAPGIPFGNSQLPATDMPADRTGYSTSDEDSKWNNISTFAYFKNSTALNQALRQSGTLKGQLGLFDWSYELNHALWDRYYFSGIPTGNSGWTSTTGWDFGTGTTAVPNSRFTPAGVSYADGYFRDDNFKAYRTAYTLLQKGALNVNSTSVVAWETLLGAFRGVTVPTSAGGGGATAGQTPYSRLLQPVAGPVTAGAGTPAAATTWAGFRALSDDELHRLAVKIVKEVKQRGPFLSLSDFVNRRLKPIDGRTTAGSTPYASWDTREVEFLGVLQAAINEAGINTPLEPTTGDFAMNRSQVATNAGTGSGTMDRDNKITGFSSNDVNPSNKPKSKLAGAPGYLMQSDVLQQIGSALSARSDTFTVRARGESDDGVVAYVEIVVQRTPAPLIAGTDTTLPINPKAIIAIPDSLGNQLFGRRFKVVSTRWLSSEQI